MALSFMYAGPPSVAACLPLRNQSFLEFKMSLIFGSEFLIHDATCISVKLDYFVVQFSSSNHFEIRYLGLREGKQIEKIVEPRHLYITSKC